MRNLLNKIAIFFISLSMFFFNFFWAILFFIGLERAARFAHILVVRKLLIAEDKKASFVRAFETRYFNMHPTRKQIDYLYQDYKPISYDKHEQLLDYLDLSLRIWGFTRYIFNPYFVILISVIITIIAMYRFLKK